MPCRSVASIRKALGVPGLNSLIRLLQVRLHHGLAQLSVLLKGPGAGELLASDFLKSATQRTARHVSP